MIKIEFHKGLPIAYESVIIDRYDSFTTSCRYIEIFHNATDINYMLLYEDDKLTEVFIVDILGSSAICLNSLSFIEQDKFKIFANELFKIYPKLKKIEYPSSYNAYTLKNSILTLRSDDYVISLTPTIDDFIKKLGSSTRSNYRKHKNKFGKDYPEAKFTTKIGSEIENTLIDEIIFLNFKRIMSKSEMPHVNKTHGSNFYKYAQHYGIATYIENEGVLIAGSFAFMSNKNIYSQFIAHDNDYSKYNPGQLCMVHLIEKAIEKGFTEFHLLWGESDYKTRFLAKPHAMYSYNVFRQRSASYLLGKIMEFFNGLLYNFKLSKYGVQLRTKLKKIRKKNAKQLGKIEF